MTNPIITTPSFMLTLKIYQAIPKKESKFPTALETSDTKKLLNCGISLSNSVSKFPIEYFSQKSALVL